MLNWALYLKLEIKEWNLGHDDTTLKKVLSSRLADLSNVLGGNAYFGFYVV